MERKTVKVAAAAIFRRGRVLICRRGYGDLKGFWEFPGGKRERGETTRETIVREIGEELKTDILPGALLCNVVYDYPAFRLDMDVFTARIVSGEPVVTEHEGMLWADRETLAETLFCPADVEIAEKIRNLPDEAWDAE